MNTTIWIRKNLLIPLNLTVLLASYTDFRSELIFYRSSLDDDFFTEHSGLEQMHRSFMRVRPKILNSLPLDVRNLAAKIFNVSRKNVRD